MEAPKLPSFIKQNRNKRFEYRPWFYDERKERLSKMKSEKTSSESNNEERKVNLREHWSRNRRHGNKQSFVRLILITAFLFLLAYLLLFK
jgi:Flp pilus assembly protein TadB